MPVRDPKTAPSSGAITPKNPGALTAESDTVIPCVVSLPLQVAGFTWNQRPTCHGISGRFHVEYTLVVAIGAVFTMGFTLWQLT